MENGIEKAIAVVGLGAILPDAPDIGKFWKNVTEGRYSVTEVTPDRWDPNLYYDPDPRAPDKSYSTIGGWVRKHTWEPVKWRLPIPPRVADAMDDAQKWAIACTREALFDYGYPDRSIDLDRTAVILGNAMSGEKHYLTALRLYFPEYAQELAESTTFASLPESVQHDIKQDLQNRISRRFPEITEDSMPGELANCIAGRIANLFNLHGPNFVVDAACASAMAAFTSAAEGLMANEFDVVITGGIDRNMGASTFIKFCKIGALSATGTRPYAEGADGFVMGEGAAIFLLKRLADAERDKDKIYAVLRGIAGSSDGKGKGITAPNPIGQKLCIERAWKNAGLSPATATMIEGHGTSTRVGDVVEVQSFAEVLKNCSLTPQSVALGSVKSNFGHLKGAAGAAGLLKTVLSLHNKVLAPSIHCERSNPDIDFTHTPLYVNTTLQPWQIAEDGVRRAGVSAFGFGGTNFHAVLEEYIPGRSNGNRQKSVAVKEPVTQKPGALVSRDGLKAPLRGALVVGANTVAELKERLCALKKEAEAGWTPKPSPPSALGLRSPERLVIDYGDATELADKCSRAEKAIHADQAPIWKALRAQGIFRGHGPAAKVAFLYPGQGSQYINMMRWLRNTEPIVTETFKEADEVMMPLLGKPLSSFIFVDQGDPVAVERAEEGLKQTAITQPAVLACDIAITRMLAAYGIEPDMTMGHSLGEYAALVASGVMSFKDALEGVSARGREMTRVAVQDNGRMAAVFAPVSEIERILKTLQGYVVIANINSNSQAVIGGASAAVDKAVEAFLQAGFNAVPLPVSHAFHTSIVAPASEPLREMLRRVELKPPRVPVVANVTGEFYPTGSDTVRRIVEILGQQIASPVQFVQGLRTLYDAGARLFVEVGPKKALQGFADDVLGSDSSVVSLFTNHPKFPDATAFNQALCGIYAAGVGRGRDQENTIAAEFNTQARCADKPEPCGRANPTEMSMATVKKSVQEDKYSQLGRYFAEVIENGLKMYKPSGKQIPNQPVVITGAALGLPGTERIFDDRNVARILAGEQFIKPIPGKLRNAMLDKRITRLVKSDNGGPVFEAIGDVSEVIKLAGRGGAFDLEQEFGIEADRVPALDRTTALAIAVGIDALRDAGIPLVLRYKITSKGTQLPDRWGLADALRDETGVIFASAFPGLNSFAEETSRYYRDRNLSDQLATLEALRSEAVNGNSQSAIALKINGKIAELKNKLQQESYVFDRRFLLRTLSMGHSQFAELIGARGPNTQLNAACASTTQAIAMAEDWIAVGRCRRVVIISADDVTSDAAMEWFGAGFLASGAAATDEVVENAAVPFDRRRHGLIVGMGAAALVVESPEAARERGIQPICEVLGTVTGNSAFHGTRLDVNHIQTVMETLVRHAEEQHGISRYEMAPRTVFVSHETYTPARGGSASAEIHSLRSVFGRDADKVIIANTKGFTGHAMATGIEDVVAVKSLETGVVPPVANFKEIDPELGKLNLSPGGSQPVQFALRLGAGFGSQISMALLRWIPTKDGVHRAPNALGHEYRIIDQEAWNAWLKTISGNSAAELMVDHRSLRIRDRSAGAKSTNSNTTVVATSVPLETLAQKPVIAARVPVAVEESASVPAPKIESIKDHVLALVAEKTGYPVDMLDLDLDLEADLGVDTVKQAEVFAAVREHYGIPRDEKLRLRDFPTLAHVMRFVEERRTDVPDSQTAPLSIATAEPEKGAPGAASAARSEDDVKARLIAIVAEKTGYPVDMLDLDLDMEADLGVDTVKQAEVFAAIREIYSIPRDPNLKLRDFPTLAHVIQFINEMRSDITKSEDEAQPSLAESPVADAASATVFKDESVQDRILDLVVEKTGYPKEMLDLDLDLEADLGVDTVKQAELFASMREIYAIERDSNLKLRDFPTLKHVINFVYQKRPDLAGVAGRVVPETAASEPIEQAVEVSKELRDDEITSIVLNIASEKTGYPADMLAIDLDLEADLGVDTVKQAEMFASVRQAFNIPRLDDLRLRDFPTLGHVIQFAKDKRRFEVATKIEKREVAKEPVPVTAVVPKTGGFEAANQIPRRIPIPSMRAPLSLCRKTGVSLGPNSRVVVMPDQKGVAAELERTLGARGVTVLMLDRASDLVKTIQSWMVEGPIQGMYWLSGLDEHPSLAEMQFPDWKEEVRLQLKSLYSCMRVLYESIAPASSFLVSATALGGQHGYDEVGARSPIGGAVVGFTKAYRRERMDALVKSVDFESGRHPAEIAECLINETLIDPGVVEIGYKSGLRWTVKLHEQSLPETTEQTTFNPETVFVVTGAAGSIVSAITADLAAASGGTFYLLDLVPPPDPQNNDLQRLTSDREVLKRDIFARIQSRGERATPALIERELARLERERAALDAILAIQNAGGKAHYSSVDLRDPAAVSNVIDRIRSDKGRIDVLVHAAGMERSHTLPDKDPAEFDLVFDVKADGFFNLLHAIGDMQLGATIAFSSIAGRFGNAGQTDYSAANDLLCKIISGMRTTHPQTRAIAIDWSAWRDIGMASRGSIPKMMELAGIDMIPPEAGIPIVRRELTCSKFNGEVLIAKGLGVLLNGGDEESVVEQREHSEQSVQRGIMVGRLAAMPADDTLTIETELDPKTQPFLYDHQIDGTPVMPGVMGVEAFAEAALMALPDWRVFSVEDIDFSVPLKFYRHEPRTVTTKVQFRSESDDVIANCSLIGIRTLVGKSEPQITNHFSGTVRLTKSPRFEELPAAPAIFPVEPIVEAGNIYKVYFHGPAYQVLARAWRDGDRMIGEMSTSLPPNHSPADLKTILDPRILELCLQTAGLWEITVKNRLGLPQHIDQVRFRNVVWEPGTTVYAIVTPDERHGVFCADVVDSAGKRVCEMRGYRTAVLMNDVDASPLQWLQAAA